MKYLVVQKTEILVVEECYIPIPMSHLMSSRSEALRWMTERGMQRDCKVVDKDQFVVSGGIL